MKLKLINIVWAVVIVGLFKDFDWYSLTFIVLFAPWSYWIREIRTDIEARKIAKATIKFNEENGIDSVD